MRRWLVVSIMAGLPSAAIAARLRSGAQLAANDPAPFRVARAMPNAPLLVRHGAVVFSGAPEDEATVRALFSGSALVVECVPEQMLDAVTGVSGSGPAFAALVVEALADGGVREGLPRDLALRLAAATVAGTGEMVLHGNTDGGLLHPASVKDSVCSPAGTTITGVGMMERHGVRGVLMDTVAAATHRGIELREAADNKKSKL